METAAKGLSPLEYTTMLVTAIVGNIMFVWPHHVVSAAGENALGSIVVLIAALMLSGLLHHHAVWRATRHRLTRCLLTSAAGLSLTLVVGVDLALLALLLQLMGTLFYADTPRWALLLPLLGIMIWGAGIRLDALGRLTQLWVPLGGTMLAFVSAVALIHATHLRPLWPQNWYLTPMGHGIANMAHLMLPVGPAVVVLAPRVNAARHIVRRAFLVAAGTISVMLLTIYALVMMMLGPNAIVQLHWPLVYSLETITLDSTFFISRMGLAVIFLWTAVVVLSFATHLRLIMQWLLPRRATPPIWGIGGLGLLYSLAVVAFPTPSSATRWILHTLDPIALGYLILQHGLLAVWLGIDSLAQRRRQRTRTIAPIQE
ncbi:hypothetical protein [Sulfobacillus harzensis]|uniref:Spore germination protein n=1 Tax=Sulfobacillus harzensis TaxID=2729629 RepID=A0A7Y0L8L5_9FIRM|nr:hypothetical protein [Sulfobacillus harzensis]NMP24967.1 hypothetical protein [Sulfobacillus harzensis]